MRSRSAQIDNHRSVFLDYEHTFQALYIKPIKVNLMRILLTNAVHSLKNWKQSSYSDDTEGTSARAVSPLDVEGWSDGLIPVKVFC